MDGTSLVRLASKSIPHLLILDTDTDDEKANFQDPANLYEYRRKMESTSNGIFKNLVFDETAPEVKKSLSVNELDIMIAS